MFKDILTRDEVQDLLSDIPDEDSNESIGRRRLDRIDDHAEITIRYLQQTVLELQREMAELRDRVRMLESSQGGPELAGNLPIPKTQAAKQQGSEPKPDVPLSRTEKYKSGRGKWF